MFERDFKIDIVPSLWPEHHIRRVFKEVNCLLVNIKATSRYMDKEMINKNRAYVKRRLEYASPAWSPTPPEETCRSDEGGLTERSINCA